MTSLALSIYLPHLPPAFPSGRPGRDTHYSFPSPRAPDPPPTQRAFSAATHFLRSLCGVAVSYTPDHSHECSQSSRGAGPRPPARAISSGGEGRGARPRATGEQLVRVGQGVCVLPSREGVRGELLRAERCGRRRATAAQAAYKEGMRCKVGRRQRRRAKAVQAQRAGKDSTADWG